MKYQKLFIQIKSLKLFMHVCYTFYKSVAFYLSSYLFFPSTINLPELVKSIENEHVDFYISIFFHYLFP